MLVTHYRCYTTKKTQQAPSSTQRVHSWSGPDSWAEPGSWATLAWVSYEAFSAYIPKKYGSNKSAMITDCFKFIKTGHPANHTKFISDAPSPYYRFLSEQGDLLVQLPDLRNEIIKTLLDRSDINFYQYEYDQVGFNYDFRTIENSINTLVKLRTLMSSEEQQLLFHRTKHFRQECIEQLKNSKRDDTDYHTLMNRFKKSANDAIKILSATILQEALRCYPGIFCQDSQNILIDTKRAFELFAEIPREALEFGEAQFWIAKLYCSHSIFSPRNFNADSEGNKIQRLYIMHHHLKTAAAAGHELAQFEKVAIETELEKLLATKSTRGGLSFFVPVYNFEPDKPNESSATFRPY